MAQMTPEMETLKGKLRATWMAGNFGEIAKLIAAGGKEFVDRLDIKPGMKVLDVACGNGNTAIPEAKRGADVIGVDIASNMIDQARERAEAEGVDAKFEVGDAEDLRYQDASFDAVVSVFGAMFAPRPELVASEFKRVCKSGGFIAMANWIPEGFVADMFKATAKHVPPPPGIPSPLQWGSEDIVRERFSEGVSDLKLTRRKLMQELPFDPAGAVEHFRKYFGPTQRAFESLGETGQEALRRDLTGLWAHYNQATDGTTKVESEYLEVIARRA